MQEGGGTNTPSSYGFPPTAMVAVTVLFAVLITETLPEVVGSSRVDLQACKLEYSIVSPK